MSKYGKLSLAALTALVLASSAIQARTAEPAAGSDDGGAAASSARPAERRSAAPRRVGGRLVVTLSGSGPMTYTTLELENPRRLVIDLADTVSQLERNQVSGRPRRRSAGSGRAVPAISGAGLPRRRRSRRADAVSDRDRPRTGSRSRSGRRRRRPCGRRVVAPSHPRFRSRPPRPMPPRGRDRQRPKPRPPKRSSPTRAARSARVASGRRRSDRRAALRAPALAAEEPPPGLTAGADARGTFDTKTIVTDRINYAGKKISLNLVDTDVKQIFRLFHEISGLNFVLDPAVEGKVTIVLDNVPWDQALDIILKNNGLDKQYENNVIRIAPDAEAGRGGRPAETAEGGEGPRGRADHDHPDPVLRARRRTSRRSFATAASSRSRGKVMVDKRTNALIISDIPKKLQPLDQLISTLDSETPQVMIEARIVETSKTFSQDLGIKWGFNAIADASTGTGTGLDVPGQRLGQVRPEPAGRRDRPRPWRSPSATSSIRSRSTSRSPISRPKDAAASSRRRRSRRRTTSAPRSSRASASRWSRRRRPRSTSSSSPRRCVSP